MKLYGFGGLGADIRVFEFMNFECEFIFVEWIKPEKEETIEAYAKRLSASIDTNGKFGILGVSFGGLIAVEISKMLKPDITILISSVETRREFRLIYRMAGKSKILRLLPEFVFNPPKNIANWVFGAEKKQLLKGILDDTDLSFSKWAINELLEWKNEEQIANPLLKIGGTNDQLIPTKRDKNVKIIQGVAHFMIVDRADEISRIINEELRKLKLISIP